jgi:putative membrane protein
MENVGEIRSREKHSMLLINLLSVIVPVVVGILLSFPNKLDLGGWTKNLSHAIGIINSLTTIFLILGLIFIKRNRIDLHRAAMTAAFALGALFLVCYVTYHVSNPSNKFHGEGFVRYVYFFILISHIALSLVVLPLVLRAMFFAVTGRFARHKSIVRFAYPIWLYVSATGVAVYFMLYHLFPAATG